MFSTPGSSSSFTPSGCLRSQLLFPVWKSEPMHPHSGRPWFQSLESTTSSSRSLARANGRKWGTECSRSSDLWLGCPFHRSGLTSLLYCHRCHLAPSVPRLLHLPVAREKGEGCEIETAFDATNEKIHGACVCNNNCFTPGATWNINCWWNPMDVITEEMRKMINSRLVIRSTVYS